MRAPGGLLCFGILSTELQVHNLRSCISEIASTNPARGEDLRRLLERIE